MRSLLSVTSGVIAQLGECLPCKQKVVGSSPTSSIISIVPVAIIIAWFIRKVIDYANKTEFLRDRNNKVEF